MNKNNQEPEIKLMPFTIEEQTNVMKEVPDGVRMIEAPEFWSQYPNTKETVVVAVLDTGVAVNHPDLKNNIIGGRNFTTDFRGDPNRYDDNNGHGTHVSGTIAATLNGIGVVGVSPNAKVLALKVLTGDGGGQYDWIIKAIKYACTWKGPNGETVSAMNLSLGGPDNVPSLENAVKEAVNEYHIPIVCAAGNSGNENESISRYDYPASYNEVISVGAVDENERLAPFSNINEEVDLVCPGVNIESTYLNAGYAKLSGTSMAAPHVSGALALLKVKVEDEFQRNLTEAELYAQLIRRTVPLTNYRATSVGNGLLKLSSMEKYRSLVNYIQEHFG